MAVPNGNKMAVPNRNKMAVPNRNKMAVPNGNKTAILEISKNKGGNQKRNKTIQSFQSIGWTKHF